MMNQHQRSKILILIFFILLLIFHHFFAYLGHFGYDDMEYARLAHSVNKGTFNWSDSFHFAFRWIVFFPMAFAYSIFGINDHSSALFPLLATVGTMWLIYKMVCRQSPWIIFISLAFFTLNRWTLFYSDKIMPDSYLVFFITLCFYMVYRERFVKQQSVFNGFVFALSVLLGFLSKESIVLLFPLFAFLFAKDVIAKTHLKFWKISIISGIMLFAGYLFIIYGLTGDFLYRFHIIEQGGYLSGCSYDKLPFSFTLKRISYELLFDFFRQGMFASFLIVIPAILAGEYKGMLEMKTEKKWFLMVSVLMLVTAIFMTTSYKAYVPFCIDPRHYLFFIPFASISAAHILSNKWTARHLIFGIVVTLLVSVVCIFNDYTVALPMYLTLGVFMLLHYFFSSKVKYGMVISAIVLFIALMVEPYDMIKYSRQTDYNGKKEMLLDFVKSDSNKKIIISDYVQSSIGKYFFDFDESSVRFFDYDEVADSAIQDSNIYIVQNHYTSFLSGYPDLPEIFKDAESKYSTVINNEGLAIYKFKGKLLNRKLITSLHNDFSEKIEDWPVDTAFLVQDGFNGSQGCKLNSGAFSPTYKKALADLEYSSQAKNIYVKVSVKVFFERSNDANLVISFERNGEKLNYIGLPLNKSAPYPESWQQADAELSLDLPAANSTELVVYVWNPGKDPVIIDDFDIRIFERN